MLKKYLYLPLEIVLREHDGKCILAHKMAIDGWYVLIAPKLELYKKLNQLPKGSFILKSAHPAETKQINLIKRLGHKIYTLDEEGLVFYKEINNLLRYSDDNLINVDKVFFWGKNQKDHFNKHFYSCIKKTFVTGAPRYEFWNNYAKQTYFKEVEIIKKKFQDFIFIPTSFGIPNSYLKGQGVKTYIEDMRGIVSKDTLNFLVGKSEADLVTFKEYLEFIPILAKKFSSINFILRPHPSENMDSYKDLEKNNKNIHIIYSNSVTPWIIASKAVLHYRSTTSIESDCLGIPTVTYIPNQPEYMSKYDLEIINKSSFVVRKRFGVQRIIEKIINNNYLSKQSNIKNSKFILFSNNKTPSEIIKEVLNNECQLVETKLKLSTDFKQILREYIEIFLVTLNKLTFFRNFLPTRLKRNPQRLDYGKRKYLGWNYEHTKKVIETANNVNKLNKNFVQVKKINDNIFLISKHEQQIW